MNRRFLVGKVAAGLALVVAAVVGAAALASADTATLTTTYHHPFCGITQSAFVEAVDLKAGDQVQATDGGTATITDVHAYHQQATTYDLTINGLHTYYVLTGNTAILVHNCTPQHIAEALDELASKPVTTGRIFGPDQQPLGVEGGVDELASGTDMLSPQTNEYLHDAAASGDIEPIHARGRYPQDTHVESKYATWMRDNGIMEADVTVNHPNGTCNDLLNCADAVQKILPPSSVMRVWTPGAAEPVELWDQS